MPGCISAILKLERVGWGGLPEIIMSVTFSLLSKHKKGTSSLMCCGEGPNKYGLGPPCGLKVPSGVNNLCVCFKRCAAKSRDSDILHLALSAADPGLWARRAIWRAPDKL